MNNTGVRRSSGVSTPACRKVVLGFVSRPVTLGRLFAELQLLEERREILIPNEKSDHYDMVQNFTDIAKSRAMN